MLLTKSAPDDPQNRRQNIGCRNTDFTVGNMLSLEDRRFECEIDTAATEMDFLPSDSSALYDVLFLTAVLQP